MIYTLRNIANISIKVKGSLTSNRNFFLNLGLLLTGVFLLDLMGVFIKILGTDYSPTFLAVARNLFGFLPVLIIIIISNGIVSRGPKLSRKSFLLIALRGTSIAGAQFCFYLALIMLEFATATTLAFASPFFLTALSIPILKAKVGLWRWSAVVLGFVGILLIMGIGKDIFSIYALLPIGAAFGYALSSVTVKLFPEELSTVRIQYNTQIITFLAAIALMFFLGGASRVNSTTDFGLIALMGASGGLGVICLISAYRALEPGLLAPFEYFGIPLAILLGWLFFSEFPISQLFPGVILIFAAGAIIIWRENRKDSKTSI